MFPRRNQTLFQNWTSAIRWNRWKRARITKWSSIFELQRRFSLKITTRASRAWALPSRWVSCDGIYRMHIHTELEKRYEPVAYTETLGVVKKIMMENLQEQMMIPQPGR